MPQLAIETFAPQLVWLAITFVLLYVVMWRVALPKIGEVLEERQNRIQHDLDEAGRLKVEAEKALAEFETSLGEARSKAHEELTTRRAEISADNESRMAAMDAELAEQTGQAEADIQAAKDQAMTGVRDAASDTAQAIVERLAGISVEPAAVAAAIAGAEPAER
jgi:F-type H+-transporting ATPase subunit b